MLAPIPSVMLKDSAVFHVPTGMDEWQKKTYKHYPVSNVHIQGSNETRKGRDNTEVVLSAILFVDAKKSLPAYDYIALQEEAQANGGTMTVTVTDASGRELDYTVLVVDDIPNVPATTIHHTELGLV